VVSCQWPEVVVIVVAAGSRLQELGKLPPNCH
jgi:hypothetical protein